MSSTCDTSSKAVPSQLSSHTSYVSKRASSSSDADLPDVAKGMGAVLPLQGVSLTSPAYAHNQDAITTLRSEVAELTALVKQSRNETHGRSQLATSRCQLATS